MEYINFTVFCLSLVTAAWFIYDTYIQHICSICILWPQSFLQKVSIVPHADHQALVEYLVQTQISVYMLFPTFQLILGLSFFIYFFKFLCLNSQISFCSTLWPPDSKSQLI